MVRGIFRREKHILKQEEIVVTIEKIVPNGYGLAFAEGLTIFVSLAAKGDRLRVRFREKKGKLAFAEILEILEPGPDRVDPPCEYFGKCGGCDFQQISYPSQLASKVEIIRDCLTRIGKITFQDEIPIISGRREFGYRTRTQWHADKQLGTIGYFKRYSHNIIDVESCPVLDEKLQRKLLDLRRNLNWSEFWAEKIEIEAATDGRDISIYSSEIIEPTQKISYEILDRPYFYDASTFFQGNPELIEALIKTAIDGIRGESALDLYCGVGLFSIPLAGYFSKVIGVEGDQKAIDFAIENAESGRLENLEFHAESVADWLNDNKNQKIDFILLDPPRSGAEKGVIENIIKLKPEQISYVSCDPATLARDLRLLSESYRIDSVTAIDLFPQTHHVETIVRLTKKLF